MTYLPCDDQFRPASSSSTHVTWCCVRNYTTQTLFTPGSKNHCRTFTKSKKRSSEGGANPDTWFEWEGETCLLHLRPLFWSWPTPGWVLRHQRCFWPTPGTRTPPRNSGPPRWLSACSRRLSLVLQTHRTHIVYTKYNNSTTNMKMTCSKDWHSKWGKLCIST